LPAGLKTRFNVKRFALETSSGSSKTKDLVLALGMNFTQFSARFNTTLDQRYLLSITYRANCIKNRDRLKPWAFCGFFFKDRSSRER
jgi:hypothetical protein